MSNVKKTILISVLVVVAILAIFLWRPWQQGGKKGAANNPASTQTQQNVAAIISSQKFEDCAKLNHAMSGGVDYQIVCQNNIALALAQKNLDISWCQKLDNKLALISDCQTKVLTAKAVADKNISDCSAVTDNNVVQACQNSYKLLSFSLSDCSALSGQNKQVACQDSYWQKTLLINPTSVNCANFSNAMLVTDCKALKSFLTSGHPVLASDCLTLKTALLQGTCNLVAKR